MNIHAQSTLNDSLLALEFRYFKSKDQAERQIVLVEKFNLYLAAGQTDNPVFEAAKRVDVGKLDISNTGFLWNAALVSYINHENTYAAFFLNEYETLSPDTSVEKDLLKTLIYKETDSSITRQLITRLANKDSLFGQLSCFGELYNYHRKYHNFYLLASAVIPGSGSALNGYPLKGVMSLAITSASAFAIVKMIEYSLYINAVLWGTGVGLKFYLGNINLTQKLFEQAEARQKNKIASRCELGLKKILERYPLTLKLK
jgi:hypothetical protein